MGSGLVVCVALGNWVAAAAAVTAGVLLVRWRHRSSVVPARATTWNGSMDWCGCGKEGGSRDLVAAEPVHRLDLDLVTGLGACAKSRVFMAVQERPETRSSRRARPVLSSTGVKSR